MSLPLSLSFPRARPREGLEHKQLTPPVLLPGLKASLERLQLEYVDVVFANRPDPNTPMEGRSTSYPLSQLMQGRASCSEVLVTVKHTHTGPSGQRWPGPWVGEVWPEALISFCELAVFRTPPLAAFSLLSAWYFAQWHLSSVGDHCAPLFWFPREGLGVFCYSGVLLPEGDWALSAGFFSVYLFPRLPGPFISPTCRLGLFSFMLCCFGDSGG